MKTALITGITGQDGSYLAGLLLSKGCTVRGLIRRVRKFNTTRMDHIYADLQSFRFFIHEEDLYDRGFSEMVNFGRVIY